VKQNPVRIISISSLVLFFLLVYFMSYESFVNTIDQWVYEQTRNVGHTTILSMSVVTQLMSKTMILVFSIGVTLLLVLRKKSTRAMLFLGTMAGSALITILAKIVFQRQRPILGFVEESGYSFPSGHALFSVVFFFLTFLLLKDTINTCVQKVAFITSIVLVTLIGASRVILGVHWFSDVIAGYALGTVLLTLIMLLHQKKMKL